MSSSKALIYHFLLFVTRKLYITVQITQFLWFFSSAKYSLCYFAICIQVYYSKNSFNYFPSYSVFFFVVVVIPFDISTAFHQQRVAPCIVILTTFTSPCNSIPNYNIYKIPNQQNAWIFIALLQTNPTLAFLSHYHVYCAQKIPETVTILELWIRQQFTLLLLLLFQIWMYKVSTVHSPECAEVWKIETLDHLTFTIKSLIYYFKSSFFLGCWISITLLWFFFSSFQNTSIFHADKV